MTEPLRIGVVGTGWRAAFYLRIAAALPDRFSAVGVASRSAERALRQGGPDATVAVGSLDELLALGPEVFVTCVPRQANPALVRELVDRGGHVLSETPPAGSLHELRALWDAVGGSGRVQVAEQYLLLPSHQARTALARAGRLGWLVAAEVSSTHGYHAVSLLRGFLGVGRRPAVVRAVSRTEPLLDTLGRGGWAPEEQVEDVRHTVATLDLGGVLGVYDFTEGQWFSPLRGYRHVLRGSHGEIVDDTVTTMAAPGTPVRQRLERRQTGVDGDLEGHGLASITLGPEVLWRNPFGTPRLSDEELAIAELLARTGAWVRDEGPEPYPLAEACHDAAIALAIDEAAELDAPVPVVGEPWMEAG